MLALSDRSQGNIVGVTLNKKVTHVDYIHTFIPALNKIIDEHGSVRVLMEFGNDFEGFELKALVDDAKFGMQHMSHFEKVALVNAPTYMEWFLTFANKLTKIKCKNFNADQIEEAWKFIEN